MTDVVREARFFAAEIKFVVNRAALVAIRDWARQNLAPDPHGGGALGDEYHVTSLYCDTDARDVFHQRGSYGRSKYRMRRYGDAATVFLERKMRRPRMLAKRRGCIDLATLPWVTAADVPDNWPGMWFRRRLQLRGLRPICQISYSRTARVSADPGVFARLTLDEAISAVPVVEPAFLPHSGVAIVGDGAIVEVKYRHHLPVLFKQLIHEFGLGPARASKYRLGIAALGLAAPTLARPDRPTANGSASFAG